MRLVPALTRPMDLRFPSNRFVLIATPVAGVVAGIVGLVRGESLATAAAWGVGAGGSAFLAWAIARELQPDRAWVATVATVLAPLGLVWHEPDLLASAVVLLVARAVAGTTGRWMRAADLALFAVVAAPVAFRPSGLGMLGVGAIGLALTAVWDRRWVVPLVTAALYTAGAVTSALRHDHSLLDGEPLLLLWIGGAAGVVSLLGPSRVEAGTDRRDGTIRPHRVRIARLGALVAATAVSITYEPAAMAPVWAALIATALRP